MPISRRTFLALGPVGAAMLPSLSAAQTATPSVALSDRFPAHDPAVVRDMVSVSHGNVARVRELLSNRPALANASWDWGYGDWETALGAASHVGNREIAAMLLSAGAMPTIFSAAMLGQLEVVKAIIAAAPGIERTRGAHGITLLAHAKAGGAADVVRYLDTLPGANVPYVDQPLDAAERAALAGAYAFGPGRSAPDRRHERARRPRDPARRRRRAAAVPSGIACLPPGRRRGGTHPLRARRDGPLADGGRWSRCCYSRADAGRSRRKTLGARSSST